MGESRFDITHMLFANDVMLFAKASMVSNQNVLIIIELFCKRSKQRINIGKYLIFNSRGIPRQVCNILFKLMGSKRRL